MLFEGRFLGEPPKIKEAEAKLKPRRGAAGGKTRHEPRSGTDLLGCNKELALFGGPNRARLAPIIPPRYLG